ncbi:MULTISPECIES: BTAD domain-containing putative transcriptional regulator [unclassified Streptomyces]|uniref:AfsR/SARP family transcriptional regulator n=1 Tax=unclassified Streptomyces TaxID=2593676 RepID=UPI00365DC876
MVYLDIGMLGPFTASVDGVSIVPSAAKQRRLLALLAVGGGRETSMAAIAEELWEGCPPAGPAAAVQTYVKQLRQRIAAAVSLRTPCVDPKEILSRGHSGYRLDMPDVRVDARVFERLVREGERAIGRGEDRQGVRLLSDALTLWRGQALSDVRSSGALRAEALRLDEVRLAAVQSRIDAELRLGQHAHLVSELTALTTLHPLQENLHAQFIVALYRSGRPSQALEAFRRLREASVRELGIEPSRRLQELHRWVLTGEPLLDAPSYTLTAF